MATHDEVAHSWANKAKPRLKGANMYFEGDTIYSYGNHFPVARHVCTDRNDNVVLFTTRDYSVTTSAHKSTIGRACSHLETFSVPFINASTFTNNHEMNLRDYQDRIRELVGKAKRAVKYGNGYLDQLDNLHEQARRYAKLFLGSVRKAGNLNLLLTSEERAAIIEKSERHHEQHAKRLIARRAAADKRAAELVPQWLRHEIRSLPHGIGKVYLRCSLAGMENNSATVQTSHGATVPYGEAKVTYKFAMRYRKAGWHDNGERHSVGGFSMSAVNENGIVIGCHRIAWEEIDRFAKSQGWA